MGISCGDVDLLIQLKENGYIPGQSNIIEIGAQQISNNFLEHKSGIEKIGQLFGAPLPHPFPEPASANIIHGALEHLEANALPAKNFWEWLGFNYAAIDIDETPDSIPLDLNFDDTPENNFGKYHVVTNFGTTEHVANQLNAFKVIHDLTSVGGVMLHHLPSQGMLNHGLINYNPKFFWMLARSNGYKWLYSDYHSAATYYDLPQNIIDNVSPFNPNILERYKNYKIADGFIIVALQKIYDTPYVPPLDVSTGTKTNNKNLQDRYWSVFKKNAFRFNAFYKHKQHPKKASENSVAAKPKESILDKILMRTKIKPDPAMTATQLVDNVIENSIKPHHHSVFWGDRLLTIDKSAGFLTDPVFKTAFESIRGSHQYDQYTSPQTIAWRLHTLVWAAQSGLALEGDFVECGVFKGDMAWVISQTVDFKSRGKQYYLYDTFDGFSDKYSSDDDFPENPGFIDFANTHYRDPSLYPYVCDRFNDRPDIKVIKGVVPDILQQEAPEKIAFLHIDLNSPAAEIGALEILFPRLTSGAILIFDDYGWKQFHKQKTAEDEFMAKLGYSILELPTGQGMVVKR